MTKGALVPKRPLLVTATLILGECLLIAGLAMWLVPVALVAAGVQLVAGALLSHVESGEQ